MHGAGMRLVHAEACALHRLQSMHFNIHMCTCIRGACSTRHSTLPQFSTVMSAIEDSSWTIRSLLTHQSPTAQLLFHLIGQAQRPLALSWRSCLPAYIPCFLPCGDFKCSQNRTCSGKVHVSVQILLAHAKAEQISRRHVAFDGLREDVVESLIAMCHHQDALPRKVMIMKGQRLHKQTNCPAQETVWLAGLAELSTGNI
jgi:hypothetical protein